MKTRMLAYLAGGLLAILPGIATADEEKFSFGGDSYSAGQNVMIAEPVVHDLFATGYAVTLTVPVAGDAHLAAYDVQSNTDIAGDLYAGGFTVTVAGTVKGDVTAIGNAVVVKTTAPISGNVRAAGTNVALDAAVDGSMLVAGRTVTINGPIKGDLSFYGETLTFGSGARVDGQVLIHAPKDIAVPASVATADRVSFSLLTSPQFPSEMGQTAEIVAKSFWVTLWAAVLWWLLLLIVGAALISLNAGLVDKLQTLAAVRPVRRIGLGFVAFAAVVGLLPVVAATVVGLLLLPFVLIFVVAACSAAYLAGVYLIGAAIAARMTSIEGTGRKIAVLAVSLVVAGLVTMIPFVGWLLTMLLVTFGFGVIAALIIASWGTRDRDRLSAVGKASPVVPAAV